MDTEEVLIAEIQEGGSQDEINRDHHEGRRISAGPIIAIVVVVIILSGIAYYMLSGSEVNNIIMLDPEDVSTGDDNRYGVEVEVHITGGMKSVDGTGKLDILFKGTVVHSQDLKIIDDAGTTIVNYNDFVMENGEYDIKFSMDGKSVSASYTARMVPTALNLSIQYQQVDEELITVVVVSPEFEYPDGDDGLIVTGDPMYFYSRHYDISTTMTSPDGSDVKNTRTMWDWNRGNKTLTKISVPIGGELMGYYSFSASFMNNLVKDESPYHEITSTPETLMEYLNRAPELGDISEPARIRAGAEVIFTFRADDPDTNDRIHYYSIDWNFDATTDEDPNTVSELEVIELEEGDSTTVRVTHVFEETGTHTISVTVADNGYVDDLVPHEVNYKKFDTEIIQVLVTLI